MFIMYYMFSLFLFFFGLFMLLFGLYFLNINMSVFMDWEILTLNSISLNMTLIFDYMSMTFMGLVMLISSMVIFYSDSYMYDDIHKYRFLILVFLFIMSMMMMIVSPNLVSMLLGWDGLGLVSYCLVIFFQNVNSYNAGMLTIITNRIGDVSILICISWMLNFGSWNFLYYFYFYENYMFMIFMLIVLSAFTKSAQIPFSSWLPAAMAAPTPVSALVHSSTLVTAGVYLLIRFYSLLSMYDCSFFLFISMFTMLMSGLGANFEFDLKKIIALSTLSQLGLMMSILFLGFPKLAFFHLLTHAFFKALLFLCAGLIIHVMNNSQDIREMGFIIKLLPYTSSCFLISTFSLCGLPFLSGFYSKDMIIEFLFMNNHSFFIYFIFLISVCFTVTYSLRLMNYLMFFGTSNYCFQSYYENSFMIFSMILLTIFSVFLGICLSWLMFLTPMFFVSSFLIKIIPILCIMFSFFLSFLFMNFYMNMNNMLMNMIFFFLGSMWYMPIFSTYMMYSLFLYFSVYFNKIMNLGWFEYSFSKSHLVYFYFSSKMNYFLEYNNIKLFLISFIFLFFIF
uniref:NADH-ubiquinone oxidoreductase chain 5 n=1 Tax=Cyrtorhinus sp. TaxID=2931287 RepID=A0A8T9ZY72_9HEMI|nr:NADH dehydrogenase subunit 5 [Cyrtorhinus sp.]